MDKPCTVTLHIGWETLRDQKDLLLSLTETYGDGLLEGVIDLIDSIQDQAYQQGCNVKWLEETTDAND
jgi:hypothetical protein